MKNKENSEREATAGNNNGCVQAAGDSAVGNGQKKNVEN